MKNHYTLFKKLFFTSLILLAFIPAGAQYCTSNLYCYGCYYNDYINSVSTSGGTTNISNPSNGCPSSYIGYSNYTSLTPVTVQVGTSFTITVVNNPNYSEWYSIYVDFNADGDFADAGETVYTSPSKVAASGTVGGGPITINVPSTATTGNSRLRIRCVYSPSVATSACSFQYGGEAEDYKVVFTPSCPSPSISQQPQNRTACEGGSTSFSVAASNASTYQWQVNTGSAWANVSGSVYSGATTNSLTLSNIPLSYNSYQYRCIVTGACNNPVNSNAATLSMNPGASIVSQTMADTICRGAITTMHVTAGGTFAGYQWQMAVATVGVFSNVPNTAPYSGTTTANLTITGVPDTLNGYLFRCIVAGGQCPDANSAAIPMTVLVSPEVVEDPVNDTIYPYNNASFDVAATANANVGYYWQASADGITYSNINNNSLYQDVLTPILTVKAATPAMADWWFRCIIKSNDPACGVYRDTSAAAQLKMIFPNSVSELNAGNLDITVYPNPVSGASLFIHANRSIQGSLSARILDKLGRVIMTTDITLAQNKTASVAVGQLPAGVYSIQLSDAEGNISNTMKFTKE